MASVTVEREVYVLIVNGRIADVDIRPVPLRNRAWAEHNAGNVAFVTGARVVARVNPKEING